MAATTVSIGGLIMLDNDLGNYNGHHRMDGYHLVEGEYEPRPNTISLDTPVEAINEWLRPSKVNHDKIARWTEKPALKILFIQTHNNFSANPDNNPRHRTVPCHSEVVPLPDVSSQRAKIKRIFNHARLPLAALGAFIKSHITFLDDSPYQVVGEEGTDGGNVTSFYASGTSWSIAWSYFHTTGHTSAVMFHREGDGDERRAELEAEILRLKHHIAHPLLLAYIKTTISLQWTFALLDELNYDTLGIEKTLGLPTWDFVLDRVIEPVGYSPNIEEDAEMIAEAQEAAVAKFHVLKGKLTNIIFRLRVFKEQIMWIKRVNTSHVTSLIEEKYKLESRQLGQRLDHMADLNTVYLHDAETLSHRLDSQMAIMSHQVAQRDARIGLTIAWQGRSSNSAMVALALAGFIFLPWQYIASLFDGPMFQWRPNGDETVVLRPFKLYWIICAGVTGILGVMWMVWLVSRKRAEEKRRRERRYMFDSVLRTGTGQRSGLAGSIRRVSSRVSVRADRLRQDKSRWKCWVTRSKAKLGDEEMEMG